MTKDSHTSEITELQKKLQENPESLVFAPLAEAYRKEKKLEEALRICVKGLEKHPHSANARIVLGRIYQDQGKKDQAASEYKKVLEADPENFMAHSLLGSLHMEAKDYQSAIEAYQKILSLNPDDETAQHSLKEAIEKAAATSKDGKPILKETKETAVPAPLESSATLTIAELYLNQGHTDKALEIFQELSARDPHNEALKRKVSETLERQKHETAEGIAKSKKAEPSKPADSKAGPAPEPPKKAAMGKGGREDFRFTSEDILQVMRHGEKEETIVEDNPSKAAPKESSHPPVAEPAAPTAATPPPKAQPPAPVPAPPPPVPTPSPKVEPEKPKVELSAEQQENLKGVLAELSVLEGITRCFLTGEDGIIVVSMGQTGNNEALAKQSLEIFQSTDRSVSQLKQGSLQQVSVTAESGNILLVGVRKFILAVAAESRVNLGILRLSLDLALKKLAKIL